MRRTFYTVITPPLHTLKVHTDTHSYTVTIQTLLLYYLGFPFKFVILSCSVYTDRIGSFSSLGAQIRAVGFCKDGTNEI